MKAALTYIASIARAVLLMVGGAYALLLYLDSQPAVDPQRISELKEKMQHGLFLAVVGVSLLDFRREGIRFKDAPARGGVTVVLLTGVAATVALGWSAKAPADFLLPGTVLVVTLAVAWRVARFVATHKGEIGEARFSAADHSKADDC